jgi:hydrogenase-4 component F
MNAAPGVYEGAANVIAALMLLLEFGMLRQALVRDQVRLYAAQSALISVLAIVIAADRDLPELYALAGLSAALKVVAVPWVLRRLLGAPAVEETRGVAGSYTLKPASAVLACIVLAALGAGLPRDTLLAFGVASLLLASLYVFGQRDIKRLLAYSSVEHMGILAIGVSFGAPVALAGVLLHVMAHAAAKGSAFMGAGVFTVKYGTKRMAAMRDGLRLLPWSGPLFLLAIFALSALPPSGIFRSEFEIVAGGLGSGGYAAAAVLVILVTLAFFGLATSMTNVLLLPERASAAEAPAELEVAGVGAGGSAHATASAHVNGRRGAADGHGQPAGRLTPGEPSAWMVVPVLAGLAVLVLLGVHPPGDLTNLITQAVSQLRGAP